MKNVFITGTAGFIGFHLAKLLLNKGYNVIGYDGMTDYYDIKLKQRRHQILLQSENFKAYEGMLEDETLLATVFADHKPDCVIHLAGQAGVRYSLENPRSYIDSNLVGTFNVLDLAREYDVEHFLMASTSSVYGANETVPFCENHKTDHPLTIYAATKKASEAMVHSYAHLHKMPSTMFRFFTVYGPWGRPDMALFKFVKNILNGEPIDIYNNGDMRRDFTYVDDLVKAIYLLMEKAPYKVNEEQNSSELDSLSPVAPFRIVNIGNSKPVKLLDFIDEIESQLKIKAIRNYMPMQKGDVPQTYADCSLLNELVDDVTKTSIKDGIHHFIKWYRDYYQV